MTNLTYNERHGWIVNDHGYQVRFQDKRDAENYLLDYERRTNKPLCVISILKNVLDEYREQA